LRLRGGESPRGEGTSLGVHREHQQAERDDGEEQSWWGIGDIQSWEIVHSAAVKRNWDTYKPCKQSERIYGGKNRKGREETIPGMGEEYESYLWERFRHGRKDLTLENRWGRVNPPQFRRNQKL